MKDFIPRSPGELENQGWLQMKAMLDMHMPVRSIDGQKKTAALWWNELPIRQIAVLIPFICISILTGRQGIIEWQPVVQEINGSINEINTGAGKLRSVPILNNDQPSSNDAFLISNDAQVIQDNSREPAGRQQKEDMLVLNGKATDISIERIRRLNEPVPVELLKDKIKPGTIFSKKVKVNEYILPYVGSRKEANGKAQTKIGFSAGVGSNSSGTRNIYPVIAASYHFNDRIAVSIGMEANVPLSPKDASKRNVSFINDTSLNIQFSVDRESIDKLVYLNVPLEYSFKVKKNVALVSGMELSFLQKVHTSSQKEVFDYSASPVSVLGPEISTYVNGLQRAVDEVEARHTNIKFNAGVSYSLGPASVEARYHYNLHEPVVVKDFNGQVKGGNKGMFSLRLLFQLNK